MFLIIYLPRSENRSTAELPVVLRFFLWPWKWKSVLRRKENCMFLIKGRETKAEWRSCCTWACSDVRKQLSPLVHGLLPADPSAPPRFTLAYGFWTGQDTGKHSRSISQHITDVLDTGVREHVRAAALVIMSQAEPGGFTAKTKSW